MDADTAKGLIKKHFPENLTKIKLITEGYSHQMYECTLEDKTVFVRMTTTPAPETSIAKELWVMEQYRKAGIPVPTVYASDTSREVYDFDYMIISKLEGENAGQLWKTLPKKEKVSLMHSLGEFMARLHEVKTEKFGFVVDGGVKEDEDYSFKAESEIKANDWELKFLDDAMLYLSGCVVYNLLDNRSSTKILAYLQDNKHLTGHSEPVLIHGDFQLDHIFIQEAYGKYHVTGICDFEFSHSFARECDFIKLDRFGALDAPDIKAAILEGYGKEKLHPEFNKALQLYRIGRDLGYARYNAKAGRTKDAKVAINNIMKMISNTSFYETQVN